jgi:type IV secretory pathway VirB2 component (pilin)
MAHRVLLALSLLLVLATLPAHAVGAGTSLAFNDTLDTIQSNLTGPTANAAVACLVVAGLIGLGFSKDNNTLKTLGGLALVAALIAKAPTLMQQLGVGGVTSHPYLWVRPLLLAAAIPVVLILVLAIVIHRHRADSRPIRTDAAA